MPTYYGGYEASAWYIMEATEGTTPGTPTYLPIGNHVTIKETESPKPNGVRLSGSVDYSSFQHGYPKPVVSVTFHPTTDVGLAFIHNVVSTDSSFTLVTYNNNSNGGNQGLYRRYVGCKVKTTTVKVSLYPKEDVVEVTMEIWGWSIQFSDVSSPSYSTIPSATALNWSDITVTYNGSTVTDWWEVNFSIDNDLYRVPTPSTGATQNIKRGVREVKFDMTRPVALTDNVQTEINYVEIAQAIALCSISLTVSHVFTFTSTYYTDVEITNEMTEIQNKKLSFQVAQLVLTS